MITRWLPGIVLALTCTVCAHADIAAKIVRAKAGGVDMIAYPTAVKDVVTIVGSLPAGDAFAAQDNVAIASLTGMMLDRGTIRQDKYAISRQLEDVGAQIGFDVDNQVLGIHARCLRKDLPLVIGLIAEQLRSPAFDAREFDKARLQFVGTLKNYINNTNFRARDAFTRDIYPVGHPNREASIDAYVQAAQAATLDQARAFHRRYYGPAHLTLVLVGDLAVPQVKQQIASAFAGWQGGVDAIRASPAAARPGESPLPEVISLADKPSVSIMLGQATPLRYRDADTLALRVGTAILGSGFTGRLMSSVRDREGLTYGINAGISEDSFTNGMFAISATFAPQLLDKGIASTRRELQRWWSTGVTAKELEERKSSVIGSYEVSLSTTGGLANALLLAVQRGYDVAWLDEYPRAIRALDLAQVNAAIRAHLDPSKMVLVEAGSVGHVQP